MFVAAAPARRSVRKQTAAAFRKPTTRSLAQPQNATVPNRDTEDEDEEEEDEEDEEEHGRDGGDEEDDEDDDDASSDGLSITRCLCGEQREKYIKDITLCPKEPILLIRLSRQRRADGAMRQVRSLAALRLCWFDRARDARTVLLRPVPTRQSHSLQEPRPVGFRIAK